MKYCHYITYHEHTVLPLPGILYKTHGDNTRVLVQHKGCKLSDRDLDN